MIPEEDIDLWFRSQESALTVILNYVPRESDLRESQKDNTKDLPGEHMIKIVSTKGTIKNLDLCLLDRNTPRKVENLWGSQKYPQKY